MPRFFAMIISLLMLAPIEALKAETLELATKPFHEKVLTAAQISGSLVTGVQQQGPSGESVNMQAFVPAAWAGNTLCAHVVSVDGLYEAKNEYLISETWSGGYAELSYPTRHNERFKAVMPDEIGIRLSRGTCADRPNEAVVAQWNNGSRNSSALLINSFQAEAVFAYIGDTAKPVRCVALKIDGKSAYDTKCPLAGVEATGPTDVQVLRIVKGKAAPPTSVTLWFHGGKKCVKLAADVGFLRSQFR